MWAFSWSTKTGEAALYINGRLAGKRADPSRVEKLERQSPSIWLGNSGSDRFKAKVGNGLYDEIRIFDKVLPAAEIFALSTSGSDSAMSALNPDIIPFSGGSAEFVTSGKTAKYAGPRKLLELDSGSSKLSLVAMGASGKVSFVYDGGWQKGGVGVRLRIESRAAAQNFREAERGVARILHRRLLPGLDTQCRVRQNFVGENR